MSVCLLPQSLAFVVSQFGFCLARIAAPFFFLFFGGEGEGGISRCASERTFAVCVCLLRESLAFTVTVWLFP